MKKLFFLFLLCISFAFASVYESDRVILKGDVSDEVINLVDSNIDNIFSKYPNKITDKIVINIYPDQKSFKEAAHKEGYSDYFICHLDYDTNELHVVSPLNSGQFHYRKSVEAAILASIEKLIISRYYNVPNWLIFCVSDYLRHQYCRQAYDFRSNLKDLIEDEDNFKLTKLMNRYSFDDYEKDYQNNQIIIARKKVGASHALAYSFVVFIVDNFGYEKILQVSKDKCIGEVFNMEISDIEKMWFEYTKYKL
ncbi:MAG: hypothetical protein JXA94_00665 [Parachlamydiales bacterium]|nr:hypothetical protein [Parachlamydiales bacterium]